MEIPELFQTFAEIGIAIAGFSGLIVSLRQSAGPLEGVQKFRLQVLLMLALGAVFLSLFPELLASFIAGERQVWMICSLSALVFSLIFLSWWVHTSRQVYRVEPEIFNWFAFARMSTGHLVVVLLLVSVLFSALHMPQSAVFSIAIAWYLLHATQQFIRMLFIPARADLGPARHPGAEGQ